VYNHGVRALRKAAALPAAMILAAASGSGCSIKKFAVNKLGDAIAGAGATYASDDDPELVRQALPFALKLIESLLDQSPGHAGLLTAAASGFTEYAYGYVQQEADEAADEDFYRSEELRLRARKLYRRARDYGIRGLETAHAGFRERVRADPTGAMAETRRRDVPLLYWTAAAWGLAITASKDDPELIADVPSVEAMVRRALELQEDYERGALHEFMIAFEGGRSEAMGGSLERAKTHFDRSVALSSSLRAAPFVSYAETVSVAKQDRAEFVALLTRATAIDPGAEPESRLANMIMQRRARWLLGRADLLFAE